VTSKKWDERVLTFLPALACLGVYLAMAPSQITIANHGADGGDFLAAALTGGIPHPTGYPTYILLLRAFLQIPFGTAYFRGSVLSAAAAAMTVLLVSIWIARQNHYTLAGRIGSLAGGLALGFSPLFWSQAVIVEVQALHGLFVILMIWWITLLAEAGISNLKKWLILSLAFLGGLSLGNHITILFVLPVVSFSAWQAKQKGLPTRWLLAQAAAFGAGCLIYLTLPLAAGRNPPINWGNPQSLAGLWWVVSGALYQGMVFRVSPAQALDRIIEWIKLLLTQFTLPALFAVSWIFHKGESRLIRWGLAWILIIYSIFYFGYASNDAVVYLIAPWIVFAIWIGEGVTRLWQWKMPGFAFGVFASGTILFCLLARLPLAWGLVDPGRDQETGPMLKAIFAKVPTNAILYTSADEDTFPVWYGHFGSGMRSDLRVVVLSLTNFQWYRDTLRAIYPDLAYPHEDNGAKWSDLLLKLNPDRPACRSEEKSDPIGKIIIRCNGVQILESNYFENSN
jgi:hypothetical protein